jgi:hypothetical protein
LKRFPSVHSLLPFDEPGILENPVQIRPLTNETLNDRDVQGDLGIHRRQHHPCLDRLLRDWDLHHYPTVCKCKSASCTVRMAGGAFKASVTRCRTSLTYASSACGLIPQLRVDHHQWAQPTISRGRPPLSPCKCRRGVQIYYLLRSFNWSTPRYLTR